MVLYDHYVMVYIFMKNVYHGILVTTPSPHLLILNQGFSSPDPELASLDENLRTRETAFRSTYNVAESRANDDDTKRG